MSAAHRPCLAALLAVAHAAAQPVVVLQQSQPPIPLNLARQTGSYTEVPPTFLQLDAGAVAEAPASCQFPPTAGNAPLGVLLVSTAWAVSCLTSNGTVLPVDGSTTLGENASSCITVAYGMSQAGFTPSQIPPNTDYRRDYYGVFDIEYIEWSASQPLLFAAMHGEDKNELWGTNLYQNTINTDVNASTCYSGTHNGTYEDCWPAYNGLVSGTLVNFTAAACYGAGAAGGNAWLDVGPVAWPTTGYVNATGAKLTYGVRSPAVIRGFDDALYVVYQQNDLAQGSFHAVRSAPGFGQGVSSTFMARNTSSGAWELPALPVGFNASNVAASFAQAPPGADVRAPLFDLPPEVDGIHMSVARLEDVQAYLAVYSAINYSACATASSAALRVCAGPSWSLYFRASYDFVTWSDAVHLPLYDADNWGDAWLQYPTFLRRDGSGSTSVNASDGLFIMGTCSHAACAQAGQEGPSVQLALVELRIE